ncbi:hypothetical protein QQS21_005237 [Conoideocrella luteorostrata]|uniref:Uncharacterized protein n=1 Tax=Conoideocrella luteorostrata TaxID=1105319 RepID=A0AAJ0CPR3_9HYPO|nr:hypothetical protein QQS21_005237 [Conoideocrella luteorostrata]
MHLKQNLLPFIFALGAFGDLDTRNVPFVKPDFYKTPAARSTIRRLTKYIKAQPPSHMDSHLQDCYYLRSSVLADPDGINIDIIAHEDREVTSGSRAATIDITKSTAKIDKLSSGWRVEGSTNFGVGSVMVLGFSGNGASMAISMDNTKYGAEEGSTSRQTEVQEDVSYKFVCPPHTTCSVQTWTYVAKLKGTCPVTPIFDPVCNDASPNFVRKGYNQYEYDILRDGGYLRRNISFPAAHGRLNDPLTLKSHYNITLRQNGEAVYRTLPAKIANGVWWHDESQYKVDYKMAGACQVSAPLFLEGGKPKRTQVIVERPNKPKSKVARAAAESEHAYSDIKITILEQNLE